MSLRQYLTAFFALGFIGLSVAGCGRAGPLEAPPQKGAEAQTQKPQQAAAVDSDDEEEATGFASPVPTPQKQPKRPLTIPNKPFILDPIL